MASGAKEGTGESGSAARAEPLKAAVGSECPICLGTVRKPAFVAYCMHQFCFRCIQHWARGREDCPVCRQALEQVLHSVRGDDDYELFVVGLPTHLRRRMAAERSRSRCPQRRYNLRRRPPTETPAPGRRNSTGTRRSQGQGAAPGPSRTPAQPAPATGTAREPLRRTGPGAPSDTHDGSE
ncbi:E3 ubiquitin-protein ligase Topors-like [Onychostruthus taczanowskii]|uniref:E3 ubiquitin-protein ligase Topors-like n=1 Tax=Onychostruthus taczanowskii TaxID=356909 RepID=UPI001B806513|nr:E3 ubiquitin-protein ligase Topors-like [Onychostruthus taczanowskii]